MVERTIYECEHCHKKRLLSKYAMRKHEDMCWFNLNNKTCLTCANYVYESSYEELHDELDYPCYETVPAVKYCEADHKDIEEAPVINCELWKEREEI